MLAWVPVVPMPRKPRPREHGVTVTTVARYLRRRTTLVRRLADAAGVTLRYVTPYRHGQPDARPRKSTRRDYALLTREEAKAIMAEFYARSGERWESRLERG